MDRTGVVIVESRTPSGVSRAHGLRFAAVANGQSRLRVGIGCQLRVFTRSSIRRVVLSIALAMTTLPAHAGEVVRRDFASRTLQRPWSYAVYLPDNYAESRLHYPVLYLLHGHGGTLNDWASAGRIQSTADELIDRGDIPPAIIVMPDGGTSWFVDRKEPMETAVIQDLIPDVERAFRAVPAREGRLIAGLSMGGFGAARFSLRYPHLFSAAALLSPAIYDPEPPESSNARRAGVFGTPQFDPQIWRALNYPASWERYLAAKMPVPMYILSGDDDEFFIETEAAKFYSLLRQNRQPAELRIVNGAHAWSVWSEAIGDAMKYLFRYATRPVTVEDRAEECGAGRVKSSARSR